MKHWTLTSLQTRLIPDWCPRKGLVFQLAEVLVTSAGILERISRLRLAPG